jgi:hypothetical protein
MFQIQGDANVRLKRKTLARNLNERYSAESVKRIIFMDEKDFTYEIARNRQNDRVHGTQKMEIPPARLYHETSRFTKKVMVSAVISRKVIGHRKPRTNKNGREGFGTDTMLRVDKCPLVLEVKVTVSQRQPRMEEEALDGTDTMLE